jgi:hypothetical protein
MRAPSAYLRWYKVNADSADLADLADELLGVRTARDRLQAGNSIQRFGSYPQDRR